jgi:hypothetical protein
MRRHIWVWGLLFCGCASNTLDVGSHDGGVMGKPGPTSESCENGTQLPIVGAWTGYIENQKWASGSDVIHMVITNANDTLACGSISLGTAPPPAPATDPNVGYPPGEFDPMHTPAGWDISTFIDYAEGFVMPIAQSSVMGTRLQFQANWTSTWDTWCAIQTPIPSSPPLPGGPQGFSCVDPVGTDDTGCHSSSGGVFVDCGKFMLCEAGLCACTAQGCQLGQVNCDTLNFDMQVAADVGTGSVALGCAGVHNVHFSRVP